MSYHVQATQSGGCSMESVSVERLDHLGVVASVIKDLRIIEMLDARLDFMTKKRSPPARRLLE